MCNGEFLVCMVMNRFRPILFLFTYLSFSPITQNADVVGEEHQNPEGSLDRQLACDGGGPCGGVPWQKPDISDLCNSVPAFFQSALHGHISYLLLITVCAARKLVAFHRVDLRDHELSSKPGPAGPRRRNSETADGLCLLAE